jgi:hypothetical protein
MVGKHERPWFKGPERDFRRPRRDQRGLAFYAAHGWRPDGHRRPGAAGIDQLRHTLTIPPV